MNPRPPRIDAFRNLSALGAGVLIAATPHCGGKSESLDDSSGGTRHERGGASGSAGVYDTSYGGYGGVGTGGYGGVGTGAYGGAVGLGGTAGACPTYVGRCYSRAELVSCSPWDAGVDGPVDGGPGPGVDGSDGTGEGGFAGEASGDPPSGAAPDSGFFPDSGKLIPPEPPSYVCPTEPPFPGCVVSDEPPPTLEPYSFSAPTWNGVECCYTFYVCP